MTALKSWLQQNQALVYFLVGQAVAIGALAISIISYSVRLETRVSTMEIRGSPHLNEINNRLTVLERETNNNKSRIDKMVEIMTRELRILPQQK